MTVLLKSILLAALTLAPPRLAAQTAVHGGRVLERHRLDLDGDGVPDDLVLWFADSLDPGVMNRVEMRMSRAGTQSLVDTLDRWDPAPTDFKGTHNLVHSRLVYVADVFGAGRLLFLFGPAVGCCSPSLAIYRLTPAGPTMYFHAPEFRYHESPDPRRGRTAILAGAGRSEGATPPPGFVSARTYDPILVYRLERAIRLDSAATIAANKEEKGGFAGFGFRADVYVVTRTDGTRALWDATLKRVRR